METGMVSSLPVSSVMVTDRSIVPSGCFVPVISSMGFAASDSAGFSVVPAAELSVSWLLVSCVCTVAAWVMPSPVFSPVLANAGTLMVPALKIIADRIAISLIFFLMSYSSSSF